MKSFFLAAALSVLPLISGVTQAKKPIPSTNAELAEVLNWIVAKYSAEEYENNNFRLFTAAEVGASRPYRFDDVAVERQKLTEKLQGKGLEPSTYLYGRVGR